MVHETWRGAEAAVTDIAGNRDAIRSKRLFLDVADRLRSAAR
jgi:hypothetical protein